MVKGLVVVVVQQVVMEVVQPVVMVVVQREVMEVVQPVVMVVVQREVMEVVQPVVMVVVQWVVMAVMGMASQGAMAVAPQLHHLAYLLTQNNQAMAEQPICARGHLQVSSLSGLLS